MTRLNRYSLTIIASAAFAGANLFIGLSMGAIWYSMHPMDFMNGFWDQFVRFTFTILPLFALTLIGLILSLRADWTCRRARRLLLFALGLFVATSVITVAFHVPLNFALRAGEFSAEEAANARRNWLSLHILRMVLAFCIPVLALKAMVLSPRTSLASQA